MNGKTIESNNTGFRVIGGVSPSFVDTISRIFAKIREERRAIDCQAERKRQMQNQLYRDAIARLPLEMIDKSWARR